MQTPKRFLRLLVHRVDGSRGLSALCAGYERGRWRSEQLAKHIIDWIPHFALSSEELEAIDPGNLMDLVRKATRAVYETEKYQLRGEFGEILLHGLMCDVMQSTPAIRKIFFKDAANDVVKGFDAVHVVADEDRFELWLGESKFYDDVNRAIREVLEDLEKHLEMRYVRREFAAITNKLDRSWPHAEKLRLLLSEEKSLDEIFDGIRIPVLLTYDSPTIGSHSAVTAAYESAFASEVERYNEKLSNQLTELEKRQGFEVRIHLFLVPLETKKELLHQLQTRLKAAQSI